LPQHLKYGPQLAQSGLAGPADRLERLGRARRIGGQLHARRRGLDVDHRHRMRDHVVQLARDPHPLGVDAPAGFLLPGLLSPRRAV
jgi:hypothetical protein